MRNYCTVNASLHNETACCSVGLKLIFILKSKICVIQSVYKAQLIYIINTTILILIVVFLGLVLQVQCFWHVSNVVMHNIDYSYSSYACEMVEYFCWWTFSSVKSIQAFNAVNIILYLLFLTVDLAVETVQIFTQ